MPMITLWVAWEPPAAAAAAATTTTTTMLLHVVITYIILTIRIDWFSAILSYLQNSET